MSIAFIMGLLFLMVCASILDGVVLSVTGQPTNPNAQAALKVIGFDVKVIAIDDTALQENPLNTELASAGAADGNWWDALKYLLSWDQSFWIGPMAFGRGILLLFTIAIGAWFVFSMGSSLIGQVRNAGRLGL
jgi:hypothetical protein